MQTTRLVVIILLNACVVGGGIVLSAYLKKKGENLATRSVSKDQKEEMKPSKPRR
jgi:hypothetical protein